MVVADVVQVRAVDVLRLALLVVARAARVVQAFLEVDSYVQLQEK
jgi:hypothetical protein